VTLAKFDTRLITINELISSSTRYSRDDIANFARMSLDHNPLHLDARQAQRARFGEIIASGQQTAAALMGMLATHFSRDSDGVPREMLCLNMNFAFKAPVFAGQDLQLRWCVTNIQPSTTLGGWIGHLDGSASVVRGKPAVVARGTILVSTPAPMPTLAPTTSPKSTP
jgi:acyl dehydratase